MYFSKNSRYVLSRANWLSPTSYFFTSLKGADKNLSVKFPKEDPSKPPLRVNIPKDSQTSDQSYSKLFQEQTRLRQKDYAVEPRSRSVISRSRASPIGASVEDGFLHKSESEIQFSNLEENDLRSENSEKKQPERETFRSEAFKSEFQKDRIPAKEESDLNEGLATVLHEKALEEALANNFWRSQGPQPQVNLDSKPQESSLETPAEEAADQKTLYIIIDVPEKSGDKNVRLSAAEEYNENYSSPNAEHGFPFDRSYSGDPPVSKIPKAKSSWHKSKASKSRSKSLSKLSNAKVENVRESNSKTRFEVHEIDDAATYIFHLRFKKNFGGRPCAVGCVPEKEVNTRAQGLSYNDAPIRVREAVAGKSFNGLGKEVTAIEDLPELVKYSDSKKQQKKSRTKNESDVFGKQSSATYGMQKPTKEVVPEVNLEEMAAPQENHHYDQAYAQFSNDRAREMRTEQQWSGYEAPSTQTRDSSIQQVGQEAGLEYYARDEANADGGSSKIEAQSTNPIYNYDYSSQSQETSNPYDYSQYQYSEYPANQESEMSNLKTEESKILDRKKSHKKPNRPDKKRGKTDMFSETEFNAKSKISSGKSEPSDFKTCSNVINITPERTPTYPMKFCAAFPPTLSKAMRSQVRNMALQRESVFNQKWTTKIDFRPKDFEVNPKCFHEDKVTGLLENSILFPKKETKFDCESLFASKKDVILNVTKDKEDSPKLSDNMINVANEHLTENKGKTSTSVDSLTMMKKVKDMVNFDLNNAIKIFDQKETNAKMSSVVDQKANKEESKGCVETQRPQAQNEIHFGNSTAVGKEEEKSVKIDENLPPKYCPTTKEKEMEMKVEEHYFDSVVTFNPDNNEFVINRNELENAISRKSKEPLSDAMIQRLEEILKEGENSDSATVDKLRLEMKGGDSILVFDEETQSWKVDYSILEKREEQMRQEQELTRRSELILETFEKLEQGHVSNIPKPDSPDKRIFDYDKEEWKIYKPEKKTSSKSKTKLPFKESDAEEIRKKNSDMYEDLFVDKKKETMNKSGHEGLGSSTSKAKKSCSPNQKKEAKGSGSSTKDSGTTPSDPEPPIGEKGVPEQRPETGKLSEATDDNYWGSFLKLDILPKDISEISEIKIPPATPKVPPAPQTPKKIEDPKTKIPPKKIEEPRFRIPIPFRGDKKIEDSKTKVPPTKGSQKSEDPKVNPKNPTGSEKKDPTVKAPPPGPTQPKDDPKSKPPPTIGAPQTDDPKSKPPPPPPPPPPTSPSKADDPKVKSAAPSSNAKPVEDPKLKTSPPFAGDKKDKSVADHYISENIVEMSKNSNKDKNSKIKPNKIETVKLNITSDKRMPSKITEINLNRKCEEIVKESNAVPKKSDKKNEKSRIENKTFYQNFEKYKTPFGDPEYEEKPMKINSDIESNPNLKKLDNWNKTLVLHDIVKPPENIESWLKDETDKMATLLLKVLQEAADGKPRKKPAPGKSRSCDKMSYKGNPYDNIRKKQETTPEQFLLKVRSVNVALDDGKKKPSKSEPIFKDIPVQSAKTVKPPQVVDAVKLPTVKDAIEQATCGPNSKVSLLGSELASKSPKSKIPDLGIDSLLAPRDALVQNKAASEPAEEIPGPEILKKISNAWRLFPVLSCQMTIFTLFRIFQVVNAGASFFTTNPEKSRRNAFGKLFTKYGPVVNIQGPLSGSVILIHKPEHLAGVFEQDASTSVRSVFDSLDQSRKEAEDKIQNVGVPTNWNEPEWYDLKKATNDPLTKGCEKFFDSVELAGEALVGNIRRNRNGQNLVSEDFMGEIKRWSMEGLCNVLFEKSFSFLEGRSHHVDWVLEPEKLYMAIDEATECLSKCERGFQTWRLMATPSSIGLAQAYRSLSAILSKQLYQAEMNLKNKNELLKIGSLLGSRDMTFVESMLLNDGMSAEEVTCNLIDIMLMGVNTMSSTLGFLLYDLAMNAKVQSKLLKEVKEALPDKNGRLDYHKLHSLKYLQACLKESVRLHTPIPIFFRVLQNDVLLSNYVIPKGTYVVMDSKTSGMKEQVFDEPEKFNPDRWLNDESAIHGQNPLFSFPFCHGPRAELAKRVAELQLWSCITKVVRNFQIEYHYGEIQGSETLISFPDKPLKLNFVERDE